MVSKLDFYIWFASTIPRKSDIDREIWIRKIQASSATLGGMKNLLLLKNASWMLRRGTSLLLAGQTRLVYQDLFGWLIPNTEIVEKLKDEYAIQRLGSSYIFNRRPGMIAVVIQSYSAPIGDVPEQAFALAESSLLSSLEDLLKETLELKKNDKLERMSAGWKDERDLEDMTEISPMDFWPMEFFGVIIIGSSVAGYRLCYREHNKLKIFQRVAANGEFMGLEEPRFEAFIDQDTGLAVILRVLFRAWKITDPRAHTVLRIRREFFRAFLLGEPMDTQINVMTRQEVLKNFLPLPDLNGAIFVRSKALIEKLHVFALVKKSHEYQAKERFLQNVFDTLIPEVIGTPDRKEPFYAIYTPQWNPQLSTLGPLEGLITHAAIDCAVTVGTSQGRRLVPGDNFAAIAGEFKDEWAVAKSEGRSLRDARFQLWDRLPWFEREHFPTSTTNKPLPITMISSVDVEARIYLGTFLENHGVIDDRVFDETGFRPGMLDISSYDPADDPYSLDRKLWRHNLLRQPTLIAQLNAAYLKARGATKLFPGLQEPKEIPEFQDLDESFALLEMGDGVPSRIDADVELNIDMQGDLKDRLRANAYRDALMKNQDLVKNKIVLDVGCGNGIVAMYAARAGAKKVYAVDCSNIVHFASKNIKANRLDRIITVIQAKVEELVLPDGVEKVDVIISESIGSCLLYHMIDKVIHARENFLAPGGILMPDTVSMYICAIKDEMDKINLWNNSDFEMGHTSNRCLSQPVMDFVDVGQLATDPERILQLDLRTATAANKAFEANFNLKAKRPYDVRALVVWFVVDFPRAAKAIKLSTSPKRKNNYWKQTVFYLEREIPLKRSQMLNGTFTCIPKEESPGDLDFKISVEFQGSTVSYNATRVYKMRSSLSS